MQDNIIYTAIIRKKKSVLCEYTEYSGKFAQITKKVLSQLNSIDNRNSFRASFSFGKFQFTSIYQNNIYVLTMSDKISINTEQENYLFAFVYKLHSLLSTQYTNEQISNCHPYSLTDFVKVLDDNTHYFNKRVKKVFDEYIQSAVDIQAEPSLNRQRIECEIDFAIMAPSDVHDDNPKEFDPLEIRASTYIKYQIPQTAPTQSSDTIIDTNHKENANNESMMSESLLDSSVSDFAMSLVPSVNVKTKKGCNCCRWMIIIAIILILCGGAAGVVIAVRK